MKLRNKKTGEIVYATMMASYEGGELRIRYYPVDRLEDTKFKEYRSIAELNEEWEDYEEPKEYWYYDTTKNGVDKITHLEDKEKDQEIGNYFETKEEAEKAVEKLKAWKRLKDNGFKFYGYGHADEYEIEIVARWDNEDIEDDLNLLFDGNNLYGKYKREIDLLFGGEE